MAKPLRIGLIMHGGRSWIGGSEYIKNIILALSRLPTDVRSTFEICLLYNEVSIDPDSFRQLKPYFNIAYDLDKELPPRNVLNRVKWKLKGFLLSELNPRISEFLKKNNINFAYPFPVTTKWEASNFLGCPWIADFQYKYLPHLFSQSEIMEWDKYIEKTSKLCSKVVLSSANAAQDYGKFFPNAKSKVEILQFRTPFQESWFIENALIIQEKYHLPDRFFLVSNQFWEHKNHEIIFAALKILKNESICPNVVFTGNIYDYRNPNYINIILQSIHKNDLASQTYLLGLIPKKDQMQLMRKSIAVIQPSLFEGWSTVIEDARCLGKRMILSDLAVHLEQNPSDSMFFERHSPQQLADFIKENWQNIPNVTPNLDQEALAKARNIQEVQEFGYRFLAIARGN